jgi:lysophospholipase L1-like esterase
MPRPRLAAPRRALKAIRDAWLLLGLTLALILVLELGARGAFALKDRFAAPPAVDPRVVAAAGAAWPIEHDRELKALADRWEPFAYFRPRPFHGSTITIDADGLRAVWKPPAEQGGEPRKPLKLALLGGSSLWGYGSRDDETIPSRLARILHERGVDAEVRNLSQIGYVNTQEVVALIRELQAGYRPDVVLFYDGVNDASSALIEGRAGLTMNERNRAREFNLLQSPGRATAAAVGKLVADSALRRAAGAVARRLAGGREPAPAVSTVAPEELSRHALDVYEANLRIVDALAARHGFRTLFAWQPSLFDKAQPTPLERDEAAKYAWLAPTLAATGAELDRRAAIASRPDFLDLRGLFRDSPQLVFTDHCHATEPANAVIAERLAGPVLDLLNAKER